MDEDPRKNGKKSDTPSSPRKPSSSDADGTTTTMSSSGKTPGTETPALTLQSQSPSSSTCSLPTTVFQTPAATTEDLEGQRRLIYREIQILFGLSMFSFASLLYLLLPATALVILAILVSSLSSIAYLMYQSAMLEWRSIVQGRGLGVYLPDSVYRQLADQSVHEWMSDPSFYLEWRYMILYFVPGITQEQLDSYLHRLSPRHQEVLNRRGLGQFMGDDFMRVLMGESRWRPRQLEADRREILLQSTSRQLFEVIEDEEEEKEKAGEEDRKEEAVRQHDDDSFSIDVDLGLDDLAVDELMAGGQQSSFFASFVGLSGFGRQRNEDANQEDETPPRPVEIVSRSQPPPQNSQDEVDAEGAIMSEAYTAMAVSYTSMAVSTATGAAAQAVEYVSPYVINTGLGIASLSLVIGSVGTMLGVYHAPSNVRTPSPHFPSSRSLWNTALFGGASAGIMLVARSVVRRSIRNARVEQAKKDEKEEENKEK